MCAAIYLLLLCIVFICGHNCLTYTVTLMDDDQQNSSTDSKSQKLDRWIEAAYVYIQSMDCAAVVFTTEHECHSLVSRTRQNIAVYVGLDPAAKAQVMAVLPDGPLNRDGGSHDAVLVFDPYPTASFGHLVLVFFIDYGRTSLQCRLTGGAYLEYGAECLTLALKNRCYNLVDGNGPNRIHFSRRCEINFLPLVHLDTLVPSQEDQLLLCYGIPGYAPCPELRPINDTRHLICNPLNANTHRCHASHETVRTRCRLYETCDHAVLIGGGGWNRDHSSPQLASNVRHMYHMLRHNGFHKNNIKIFYANGARGTHLVGDDAHSVYPSVMKLALRYHLQKICQSPLCADTLVIYLNNPSQIDGTMLLWDTDGNGQSDDNEVYFVNEIIEDLQNCAAQQVYLLVDQSFAGQLVKVFDQSSYHSNVIIMGSGQDDEYSWNSEFTKYWASLRNHSSCMTDVHQHSHEVIQMTHPTMHDGSEDTVRTTIFGAPCDIRPAFTNKELQQKYFGCQNIPTKVWMNKFMTTT